MIRLRDCDVGEPAIVDDEFITRESDVSAQPSGTESPNERICVCVLRIMVVMESVVDVPALTQSWEIPHPSCYAHLQYSPEVNGGRSCVRKRPYSMKSISQFQHTGRILPRLSGAQTLFESRRPSDYMVRSIM